MCHVGSCMGREGSAFKSRGNCSLVHFRCSAHPNMIKQVLEMLYTVLWNESNDCYEAGNYFFKSMLDADSFCEQSFQPCDRVG